MNDEAMFNTQPVADNFAAFGPYQRRTIKEEIPIDVRNYSEDTIVKFINDRIWGATQAKQYLDLCEMMPRLHRAYKGIFKNNNVPKWRSQLYVRLAFKTIETLRAYFQDAFFGSQPYITVDGSLPKYVSGAKNLQKLYDYEMYHTKFEMRFMDVLNYALKFGTCPIKTYWRFYVDFRHTNQFKRNKMGFVEKESKGEKYLKWDDPWFTPIDPRKIYPDPLARYMDECRYVIERYETDLDQLYKDKSRYGYINLEHLNPEAQGYPQYGRFEDMYNDIYPNNQWISRLDEARKRVFIYEYWGRLDLPGNQDDPRIYRVLLANNRHIISMKPSNYAHGELPYQFLKLIPQEESLYGIGAIEPILTDNYIMNALVNMRIDAMQYFLNPRILINRGALADRHSIEWSRPGELIPVNSGNDLGRTHQQIAIQDTGINTFQNQLQFHMRHAEETMAINPNAAGSLSTERRSATESSMAMSGANARFNAMVKYMKFSGFDGMIRQYGSLMQQYISEKHFPILNPETLSEKGKIMGLTGEDIQGEMLYRVKDNTQTNKDVRQQLITNLIATLAPHSQQIPGGMTPLLKGLLEISPIAGELNLDEMFSQIPKPDIMNQESAGLEQLGGIEGMPGQAAPGTPAMGAGTNPAIQATANQAGGGGLF